MILQKLHDDCDLILRQTSGTEEEDEEGGLPPSGYLPKAVRWLVDIRDGMEPTIVSNSGLDPNAKKDKGAIRLMPECKRAGTVVRPFLFADAATYVFGVNLDDKKADNRLDAKHQAFVKLARDCADKTKNPFAEAVAALLEDERAMALLRSKIDGRMDATHTITFLAHDGSKAEYVVDQPEVQAYWAKAVAGKSDDDGETLGIDLPPTREPMCLLSGVRGPVEEMMPLPVRGLFGGNPTGTHIVSGNFPSMGSHGWKRAQSSPISRGAGEKFGQALNALLASEKHRRRLASSTYVFWVGAGNRAIEIPMFADAPDPQTVDELLRAPQAGKRFYGEFDDDAPFYVFGLLPNVARIAVRSALSLTVKELDTAQREWFTRLKVATFDEKNQATSLKPLPIKTLTVAGYRDFKDVPASVEDALVQCALLGPKQAPLPLSLLNAVVLRCRAEQDVTYPRAALLKFYLTQDKDLDIARLMENETTDNLPADDPATKTAGFPPVQNTAYHLGRLFSELEAIQAQAIPGANATIADRFYGSASSTPASVFGILLDGAQNHLGKIRKDKPGAHAGAQKRLEEILALIDGFPKTLTLPDQALFSLGYYHHRAAKRKEISERSAAKRAAAATQTSTEIDTDTDTTSEGNENE